ncbi:MAG: hypothetical protein KGJ86_19115, partial [Chloroflexota bacterium]|nr:hypothetical protein [Chloroflexota bacterium]
MAKPEDVLTRVLNGELTMEEALRQHPDMEDRLNVLTRLTDELAQLPRYCPSAEFRNAARLRLLQRILVTQQRRNAWQQLLDGLLGLPAWARSATAVILVGGALTTGTGFASTSALPDSTLYPVKRAVEQVQLSFAFGEEAKAGAYLGLADQRAAEMSAVAGSVDEVKLRLLVDDYGQALDQVQNAVAKIVVPSPQLLNVVQVHLASQATELEARALNSSSKPAVQQVLTQAEANASNVSDHVVLIAEARGRPNPSDVRLAANPPAAATAVAQTRQETVNAPAEPAGGSASANASPTTPKLPSALVASPDAAGAAASLDTLYDRVWNQVAAAPFMARDVRLRLEQSIAKAKQDTHDGRVEQAVAELNAATSLLRRAVAASQATEYTANRLSGQMEAIAANLSGAAPPSARASRPAARDFGLRALSQTKGANPALAGSAGLDARFDRAWNQVAAAPFMGREIRLQLEQAIAAAKQETRAGHAEKAIVQLNAATALLQRAAAARQATAYTANLVSGQLNAIVADLRPRAQDSLQ